MDVYIFDVDGTLTPSRQPITDDFYNFFKSWLKNKDVFLVTGSDYEKLEEQLPKDILDNVKGIFTCMGNEYREESKITYTNEFHEPAGLRKDLENLLLESSFPIKSGRHLEERIGMLNYSIVGRNCTLEERENYALYDMKTGERELISRWLNNKYGNEIEVVIGGEISVDIFNLGKDKSQVLAYLKEKYLNENSNIIFYGDKTAKGGNDYALARALENSSYKTRVCGVDNYCDTWKNLLLYQIGDEISACSSDG